MSTVYGEVPTGLVNGSNTVYTLANSYLTGKTRVYLNGVRKDLTTHYTETSPSAGTITFITAPATSTDVRVDYDIYGGAGANTWTQNPDGSAAFNGTVLFPAGTDLASGMAVAVFGPAGGTTNFAAVSTGLPGLPPVFDSMTASSLAYGASPTVTPTLVSPGGNGTASHYTVAFGVPQGQQGPAGTFEIQNGTDLSGTAALKNTIVVTGVSPTTFGYQAQKVGTTYSVTISSTSSTTAAQKLLGQITIPQQPFAWVPKVAGLCVVNGAVDTRVDLVARVGDPAAGDQCGYCYGQTGATPPTLCLEHIYGSTMPGTSGYLSGSTGYAQVPAGTSATVYLRAENQTASSNPWSTGSGGFSVKVDAVP